MKASFKMVAPRVDPEAIFEPVCRQLVSQTLSCGEILYLPLNFTTMFKHSSLFPLPPDPVVAVLIWPLFPSFSSTLSGQLL